MRYYDGSNWTTLLTVQDGDDDGVWHSATLDLSGYTLSSGSKIEFRGAMSSGSAPSFYVDNVEIQD